MRYSSRLPLPLVAVGLLLAACQGSHPGAGNTSPTIDPEWAHRWWVQKTARALTGGAFQREAELKKLQATSREQTVNQLVADPRFGDMMLSFNLDFIGFPVDRVKYANGDYYYAIYQYPHAITSARAVVEGGDYFSLMTIDQPLYLGPLATPQPLDPKDKGLDAKTVRRNNFDIIQAGLQKIQTELTGPNPPGTSQACGEIFQSFSFVMGQDALGLPVEFIIAEQIYGKHWYKPLVSLCGKTGVSAGELVPLVADVIQTNEKVFEKFAPFEQGTYRPRDLKSIRALDTSDLEPDLHYTQFSLPIAQKLQNSSTNLNRRRAAYVLKRYFCDDLTPVNIQRPATHASDVHGSDPACFSCHYKLDPIGGFFRNYGAFFIDFTKFPTNDQIFFDDGVTTSLSRYTEHWKAPSGSPRTWNVGYIRSSSDERKNTYGEKLEDLVGILRTAPEVKHCVVQRMYEYLVSKNQTVDGDYLDYLAEDFTTNLKVGSGPAMRELVSKIVLSRAYSTPNPDPNTCYDYRPGHVTSPSDPPCRIASILRKNCTSCHGSTEGSGRLDLSHFLGGKQGFPHLDGQGRPESSEVTLSEIVDRVSSLDPSKRMPYLSDMPSEDRQALYTWASQTGKL